MQTIAQLRCDFYVYILFRSPSPETPRRIIDPSTGMVPFYVGKGCTVRMQQHFDCARVHDACKHLTCRVIRKEQRQGGQTLGVKIAEGITEQAAFDLEKLFITLGAVYDWPLVNQTIGGEGVAGYIRDEEWRLRRSKLAKQMVEEGRYEHLKTVNIGRTPTPEDLELRSRSLKQTWGTPEMRELKRQQTKEMWKDPEYREHHRQMMLRPEIHEKLAFWEGKESPRAKTYPGFRSPDGEIYNEVKNLTRFARAHGLQTSGLCLVAQGKQPSHLGWTLYPPLAEKPSFRGPGFRSPSGEIFTGITNLTEFCEQHDLSQPCMSQVNTGKLRAYKGWTRYDPDCDQPRLL